MGEMADYTLDQVEDFEERRMLFRTGGISIYEAYDEGIVDELGFEPLPSTGSQKVVTCRCCGVSGLFWKKVEAKWRLFNEQGLHNCKVNPLNGN